MPSSQGILIPAKDRALILAPHLLLPATGTVREWEHHFQNQEEGDRVCDGYTGGKTSQLCFLLTQS